MKPKLNQSPETNSKRTFPNDINRIRKEKVDVVYVLEMLEINKTY
jgi:hypothetical protein